MCVSASVTPRASSAAGPHRWMPSYRGPLTSRGSRTVHWIHGLRSTSSGGGRESAIDDHTVDPPIVTLSKVCSSPVRNSSSSAGEASPSGTAASQLRSMSPSSKRNVDCAPAPAGGLATSGNPTWSAKAVACPALRTSACRAHGIPAACSVSFICDLSRTLIADRTSMPAIPRPSRTCAIGTCSCSRAPTSRSTRPSCPERPDTAQASWRGSSASSTRQCAASRSRRSGGIRSTGSQVTRPIRTSGSSAATRTNRAVASSRYGATKAATTMRGRYARRPDLAVQRGRRPALRLRAMNVVFVDPAFPSTQRHFVRALAEVGASVYGVGDRPADWLDDDLRSWMVHYHQVPDVTDVGVMTDAVRWIQDKVWVDRLEATIESHTLAAAQVRENCTIPGTSVRTAWLCRDKPSMKQVLRDAGVPTAASTAASTAEEVRSFAREVGYPLILKPRSGAGALDTTRVDDDGGLDVALGLFGAQHVDSIAVEEFVEGHEGFYDTISVDGVPALDFVSHYFPNVLEAMRTRWISPQFVATNRLDAVADYQELRDLGRRVNEALGIGTSATHMEWFFGPKGLKFSEIGCRPPGVGAWDLYSAGNDLDIYRQWADSIVHDRIWGNPSRAFAAGIIALRPDNDGTITGYSGVDDVQARYGQWVIDAHLPPPGTPTQPETAGYMANAYVRMRHPDFDTLRGMLDDVGRTVHVHAN